MKILQLIRSKNVQLLFVIFLMLSTLNSFLWIFTDVLKHNFNFTASEVLGADASIESNVILPKALDVLIDTYPIKSSKTINFTSMAISEKASTLAHVRAIDSAYPLKGQIKIKTYHHSFLTNPKIEANQIWVDEALKVRLGVNLLDKIQLGNHVFELTGIIQSEPARAGMIFVLAPKIIIRIEDVEKTGLVQPYSRVLYQMFIQGKDTRLSEIIETVKNQFKTLKVYTVQEGRPFANAIFDLAERYLGIFIVLIVILSGIGMMVLSQDFASKSVVTVALFKTFGYGIKEIVPIYFFGFLFYGLAIIVCAIGLALGGMFWLSYIYPEYILINIDYLSSVPFKKVLLTQVIASLVILFGFGFMPILRMFKISPMYLFKKQVSSQAMWPAYLFAIGAIIILLFIYIPNTEDVLMIFSYMGFSMLVLFLFFYALLSGIKIFPTHFVKILIHSRRKQNSLLIAKFGILFLVAGLLWVIGNNFFNGWLSSIPDKTPNQFMINMTDNNKAEIQKFWKKNGIELNVYPTLTARLKQVNNQARTFHRSLNISYMESLPEDNKILSGSIWNNTLSGKLEISIEQNFAQNIQAKLGDILTFDIGGEEISGKIINVRSLKWESFKPNFYIIFPEKVLESFPKTYISSMYLPVKQLNTSTEFLKKFPTITLIDVTLSLEQVKSVLSKVVIGLKYLTLVIFALACLVYYAIMTITFSERQYETALLRSFGASQQKVMQLIVVEFALIGGISGGFGSTGASILAILLSKKLSMTYSPNGLFILVGVGLGILLTSSIGWLTTYKVVKSSPLLLLKEGVYKS